MEMVDREAVDIPAINQVVVVLFIFQELYARITGLEDQAELELQDGECRIGLETSKEELEDTAEQDYSEQGEEVVLFVVTPIMTKLDLITCPEKMEKEVLFGILTESFSAVEAAAAVLRRHGVVQDHIVQRGMEDQEQVVVPLLATNLVIMEKDVQEWVVS
jgi:hypothetical protein